MSIQTLKAHFTAAEPCIDIVKSTDQGAFVLFRSKEHSYSLYIDDEYGDLNVDEPLLHFELVLRSLEILQDAQDYEQWLHWQSLEGHPDLEAHYTKGKNNLKVLEAELGTLSSHIPNIDWELNAGEAQQLRNKRTDQ